jgi:hypothetical protein
MTDTLQKALEEVRKQIARKTHSKFQLEAEIAQLQATQIGLQNALGQQIQNEIAWTQLVLAVLNTQPGEAMTAVQIRDTLQQWGYAFEGVQNPLALVNTCVQRLAEQGRAVRSERGRPFRFSCE